MIDKIKIKQWYNKRHQQLGENAWRPYRAYFLIFEYFSVKPGRKLLDIGCGTGYFLKLAHKKGLDTYGVDISEEGIKIAKRISPNSNITLASGENLPFPDNYFDYITCLGALEHFLDMEKGIKEMVRVAKPEARFCIIVPNKNFIYWKLTRKKGTEQQEINEQLLSLNEWKNLFEKGGLKIEKIYQDKWHMYKINIFNSLNPLSIIKSLILKLTWMVLPLYYTYQFVFICKKKNAA